METLLLFLLKSIVISGILCAWYLLALKNKRLHRYNRFFLLFTLYASIQVPLLNIEWPSIKEKSMSIYAAPKLLLHKLDAATGAGQAIQHSASSSFDWKIMVVLIAAMISAALLILMLARVAAILRIGKRYSRKIINGVVLINTDLPKAPFSFMGKIYWRNDLCPDTKNGRLILQHEMAHVMQKHTYDRLASQLLTCIFWMNPFYWLIQKELGMVHEFLADEKAIVNNNEGTSQDDYTDAFARMLLQVHSPAGYFDPHHQFFSSPIKRRLIMLQANRKIPASWLRRAVVLPLIGCSIFMFGMRPATISDSARVKADKKIILVIDPAHGGKDRGGHEGVLEEKNLTLKMAKRIKELAPAYNVEVHLTRTGDEFVSLQDRADFSNNLRPDFFICLHIDQVPGKGTFDIAINSKNASAAASERLALALYKHAARPEWEQQNRPSEKDMVYVLKENNAAAVLIEMGNILNPEQMQHIEDDAKLTALCSRMLEGVVEAGKE